MRSATPGEQSAFLRALLIGALIYAIIVATKTAEVWDVKSFNWTRFGVGVSNIRQVGFYGITLVGLSIGLLANKAASRPEKLLAFAALFAGFCLLLGNGGRSGFGGGLVAVVAVLIFAAPGSRQRLAEITGLAILCALPIGMLHWPSPLLGLANLYSRTLVMENVENFDSSRLLFWKETFERFLDRPAFGYGEDQFRELVQVARRGFNHPHNSVLQFLFQWGLVGTSLLTLAFIDFPARAIKASRERPDIMLPAIGPVAGLLAMSLLEGSLYHTYPIMIIIVCTATIYTVSEPLKTGPQSRISG